jgi:hypothetical protein
MRLVEPATVNSECRSYVIVPKQLRQGQVIFGMMVEPIVRHNVADHVRRHSPVFVHPRQAGYQVRDFLGRKWAALSIQKQITGIGAARRRLYAWAAIWIREQIAEIGPTLLRRVDGMQGIPQVMAPIDVAESIAPHGAS